MAILVETETGSNWLQPYINAADARTMNVGMKAAIGTYSKGQVLAQRSDTKKYEPYVNAGSFGLGVARVVCAYDFTTDANGNVTTGNRGELPQTYATMYIHGTFKASDLVGTGVQTNLASVVADLQGTMPTDQIVSF